jgi:hypothetical protein
VAVKYSKWQQNRPNCLKFTNIFHYKTLQNLPQIGIFWFENRPSGNPAALHEIGDNSSGQCDRMSL